MRTYIAGPMTGIEALNFPLFHRVAAELRARGIDAVNPAEINADSTATWHACMRARGGVCGCSSAGRTFWTRTGISWPAAHPCTSSTCG